MKPHNYNKCNARNFAETDKSLKVNTYEVPDQKAADMLYEYNLHNCSFIVLYHALTDLLFEIKIIVEFE